MALKRRLRYEDTGARKCRKIFHAKLKENQEKLCIIAQLRDCASNRRGDVLNIQEDVRPETIAAAGEHVSHIDEHDGDIFGEPLESINVREEDEELSLSDRVLCYALYVQHCGFSMEEVRMMEKVWGIIYGKPPPFTYQDKVIPLKKEILAEYDPTRLIFCASCKRLLRQYRDMCENPSCPLYKCHLKRAKGVQRNEVYLINMVPQLSDLLENEIREIIHFHRQLHQNMGGPISNRSDVRFFESFYQGIESVNDFGRNRLKILLSLSIDGFVPKRLTRREVWPIYLRVDNLDKAVADKYYNSILCGVYFSFSKPSSEMLETLFSRLESEIKSLDIEPLVIEVDDVTWVMNVEIQRGIADMGAQRALFGLPHWESSQGCSKCYITGERINNHRVWICREGDDKSLRSSQSFFEDGENRTNGVPGVTPVMRIVTPSQFMSDALHVCSEGVTKDRLRDMISATNKFPSLRLGKEAVDGMKNCLMHITSHTYARGIVHSLEVLNMAKAKEIDELAFIVFPLAASTEIITSPIAAISLLGYWLCIRIAHDFRFLTTGKIGVAQRLAALTKRVWIAVAPEVFTMKTHEFVKSEAAFRVQKFDHDFFLDSDTSDHTMLSSIAHFLMSEIQIAKYDRLARAFESQSRKATLTNGQERFMSLNNLTRTWKIEEAPPFKCVEIPEMLVPYTFNDTEPCHQNFARLFRFIFQQLTEPPQRIQEYAIRYYRKAGRERHLRNLPATVELTLMDFALDLIGLGDTALRLGKTAAHEMSRFYLALGQSENERQKKLDELLADFDLYKAEILKGLQLALKDIRSYEYDMEDEQWYSHAKRRRKTPETSRLTPLEEVENEAYRGQSLQ